MTITIDSDTESRLREKAAREGKDIDTLASTLLNMALVWEAQDRAEAVEGIRLGWEACEQGRMRPFREFAAEQRAKFNLPSSVEAAE